MFNDNLIVNIFFSNSELPPSDVVWDVLINCHVPQYFLLFFFFSANAQKSLDIPRVNSANEVNEIVCVCVCV